jgi:hypothetical protein
VGRAGDGEDKVEHGGTEVGGRHTVSREWERVVGDVCTGLMPLKASAVDGELSRCGMVAKEQPKVGATGSPRVAWAEVVALVTDVGDLRDQLIKPAIGAFSA